MVALIALLEVEIVLFGHLALLFERSPKSRQNTLLALRLITRRSNHKYGVLELMRSDNFILKTAGGLPISFMISVLAWITALIILIVKFIKTSKETKI